MTAFLALLVDAIRRARDRRAVTFLIVLGLVVAAFCASLGFTQPDPRESLRSHLENFSSRSRKGPRGFQGALALRHAPRVDARAPSAEDDLPLGLDHVAVADLEITDLDDFDRVARAAVAERIGRGAAARELGAGSLTARQRMDAVAADLRDRGWETVITRAHDDAGASLFVAASTAHLAELEGKWKFSMLFGAAPVPIEMMSPAAMVIEIERAIAVLLGGMIGMLVLLVTFGGAVPDLLQKGSLDLVLARPIGRTRLLLCTYAGAVLTVLIVTALLFATCAVTLGIRSGHLSPAFVGCALSATVVFAAVYPVAMLVGLVTRHANFSAIAALACYGAADILRNFRGQSASLGIASDSSWMKVVDVVYWIAPKTSEITMLGQLRLGRTELSAAAFERFGLQFPNDIDAGSAYGTTALFAAAMLFVTILLFRRRDC